MQVGSICNADAAPNPPRTNPREEAGANENQIEINDNAEENIWLRTRMKKSKQVSVWGSAEGLACNGQSSEIGMQISSLHPK